MRIEKKKNGKSRKLLIFKKDFLCGYQMRKSGIKIKISKIELDMLI